jgi:hypothetical protein
MRDLPRIDKTAQIGDARNDENLIVAQFHTAFLRFHNAVVDWVGANEKGYHKDDAKLFERARQLTRWHYQWLVVHDYLETVTTNGTVDRLLYGGLKHYAPREQGVFMPLEFSVAAYRFGHSMVRAEYDYNRNFGRGSLVLPRASFELIFQFTGGGFPVPFLGQGDTLPFNWIIEWDRFIDKGDAFPDRFARKIDTRLAPPLTTMINQGNQDGLGMDIRALLKHLAKRNLLRGYLLSMPTGQAVASAMGVTPLTEGEILQGNGAALNQILMDNGFIERTPLWYYVLKEAEVRVNGNSLGELGSRLVAETIIGLVENDPDSYRNQQGGWDPSKGVRLPNGDPVVTIGDFLRFAGVMP